MNSVGLLLPYTPPMALSSMALSIRVSAVTLYIRAVMARATGALTGQCETMLLPVRRLVNTIADDGFDEMLRVFEQIYACGGRGY